jgi:NADPH-dependent 2,4-dienoyl-CoA reductase/sulfur reductase-like enzyme
VKRNTATTIDPANRSVLLANGATLTYDRLIVAPGIEFDFAAIEGHSATLADSVLPHAWKAGSQTTRLQALLRNMKPGGTFVLSVPPAPYRCPPAPYERASLVAWWLKRNNPTAKVMILDGNDSMPKQPLFEEAWNTLTPGMITRITKANGGTVRKVDAVRHIVSADAGSFRAHVANLIVPHRAPEFARSAGLADATGWCPVDPRSFESRLVPGIHVIGDAASCGLPKSATSGMAEAKVCAKAVAAMMAGEAPGDPMFINTCYSVVQPDYAFGLAGVYRLQKDPTTGRESIVAVTGASGTSPTGQNLDYRKKEAEDAEGWYRNMVADAFA